MLKVLLILSLVAASALSYPLKTCAGTLFEIFLRQLETGLECPAEPTLADLKVANTEQTYHCENGGPVVGLTGYVVRPSFHIVGIGVLCQDPKDAEIVIPSPIYGGTERLGKMNKDPFWLYTDAKRITRYTTTKTPTKLLQIKAEIGESTAEYPEGIKIYRSDFWKLETAGVVGELGLADRGGAETTDTTVEGPFKGLKVIIQTDENGVRYLSDFELLKD